jgi:hypothetical protein
MSEALEGLLCFRVSLSSQEFQKVPELLRTIAWGGTMVMLASYDFAKYQNVGVVPKLKLFNCCQNGTRKNHRDKIANQWQGAKFSLSALSACSLRSISPLSGWHEPWSRTHDG